MGTRINIDSGTGIQIEADPDIVSVKGGSAERAPDVDDDDGRHSVPEPNPAKRRHFEFSIPSGVSVTGWGRFNESGR